MSRAAGTTAQVVEAPAEDLRTAAQWVTRFVPARPPVAVLGGVVLDARDGLLSLSGFDYETYGSIGVEVTGALDEPVLVHGHTLAATLGRLSGPVRIERDGADLIVASKRAAARVRLMPFDDYPSVPPAAPTVGTVDAERFAQVVHDAAEFVSRDKGLDMLWCLHLTTDGDVLSVWATDRYRAAHLTLPWDGGALDAVLSAAAVQAVVKGMTGRLEVGADEHRVSLTAGGRTATVTRYRGQTDFPDLSRLWSPRAGAVHADRAELGEAIATAALAVEDKQGAYLDVTPEAIVVSAASDRATVRADVDATGDLELTWVFRPEFLSSILAVLPGVRAHLAASSTGNPETRAVVVTGADRDGQPVDGATFVLVPIRATGARP